MFLFIIILVCYRIYATYMATDNPLISEKREDNYELELSRVREKIKNKFADLNDCLKARKRELLRELDKTLASYLSYRREMEKLNKKKIALETTKEYHQNQIAISPRSSIHEKCISQINAQLKSIETPTEPRMVTFECDSNRMFAEVNKLGKLVEKLRSDIDYTSKKKTLISICEKGNGMEQLYYPQGVTVDNKTQNIYITDSYNNCVKVFDSTGKYLLKFGDNEGEGMMYLPRGVAIYEDRILVTQYSNCILNYQLNGMFICKIGREGKGVLEFAFPCGLTVDESIGDIYICDCYNNRIQILSTVFSFKSQFGNDTLKYPLDVKLSKVYIFVLDAFNHCLHLFDYNHILQKSVIPRGTGMQVFNPSSFFRDESDNILISDEGSNSIFIFNSEFHLIHKISVSNNPTGVTVDKQKRVIVVSKAYKYCLQIF